MKKIPDFFRYCFLLCLTPIMAIQQPLQGDDLDISQVQTEEISPPGTPSFNVVLEPLNFTVIFSEITSQILKIHKRMGDAFEEKEVLMELDQKVYRANYAKAKAAVTKFKSELEAIKVLFADEAMSQFELNDSYASLASSEADLQEAQKLLDATRIKAPYKGKVVRLAVQEYELAQQGKELIAIVNNDILFAKFLVPSRLLTCLHPGLPVEIEIRETGERISSRISRIAPVIDPTSSTIKVEAEIDNAGGRLWGGMTGLVKIKDCK